eukprot:9054-Heterococcus_DN1.PRE.2
MYASYERSYKHQHPCICTPVPTAFAGTKCLHTCCKCIQCAHTQVKLVLQGFSTSAPPSMRDSGIGVYYSCHSTTADY